MAPAETVREEGAGVRPKGGPPGVTVKLVALVAVPSSVVTTRRPVVAPKGTVVVTVPGLLTVNVAAVPLNETAVAPVKFVPVMVTPVPTGPLAGAKEDMAGVTVKRVVVFTGPPGVVTVMGPVVAPAGTVVVIVPVGLTVNVADAPLNETAVAPVKVVPVIVTPVPAGPKVGANGLKLIPSRKAMMSSVAVGPIAGVLIGPEKPVDPGELAKLDEL
jgi:hypothetical protein